MELMLYFSYGSNMSTLRLRTRVPSACAVAVGRLHKHRLKFHKKSKDNSGKCDAECTNKEMDVVYGVVFEITDSEKPKLDKHEGLNDGYEEKSVSIYTEDGKELKAVTYYASNIDSKLKPYDWYKEHVVRGAKEHYLPLEYIKLLVAVESVADSDQERHKRELLIYG